MRIRPNPKLCGLTFIAALAAAPLILPATPAVAQDEVDELVIIGRIGPDGEPDSLSRPVSYADLDLVYYSDREELKARIRVTARDLCRELGETGVSAGGLGRSCDREAYRDAMKQARIAFDEAPERHLAILAREEAEAEVFAELD
jgi:UrcA family protein